MHHVQRLSSSAVRRLDAESSATGPDLASDLAQRTRLDAAERSGGAGKCRFAPAFAVCIETAGGCLCRADRGRGRGGHGRSGSGRGLDPDIGGHRGGGGIVPRREPFCRRSAGGGRNGSGPVGSPGQVGRSGLRGLRESGLPRFAAAGAEPGDVPPGADRPGPVGRHPQPGDRPGPGRLDHVLLLDSRGGFGGVCRAGHSGAAASRPSVAGLARAPIVAAAHGVVSARPAVRGGHRQGDPALRPGGGAAEARPGGPGPAPVRASAARGAQGMAGTGAESEHGGGAARFPVDCCAAGAAGRDHAGRHGGLSAGLSAVPGRPVRISRRRGEFLRGQSVSGNPVPVPGPEAPCCIAGRPPSAAPHAADGVVH